MLLSHPGLLHVPAAYLCDMPVHISRRYINGLGTHFAPCFSSLPSYVRGVLWIENTIALGPPWKK